MFNGLICLIYLKYNNTCNFANLQWLGVGGADENTVLGCCHFKT